MANSQLDTVLRYIIETSGDKQLIALAKSVDGIAQSSDKAAPEAQKLIDELAKLSQQSSQLSSLVKLKAAFQETGDALSLAKIKTAELQKQFDSTIAPTAALTRALDKAKITVTDLEKSYNKQQAGLTTLKNSLAAAGVDTTKLDSTQRGLQSSLGQTTAAAAGLVQQATRTSEAQKNAAQSTKDLAKESKNAGGVISELKSHLVEIAAAAGIVAVAFKGIEFGKESVKGAADVEAALSRVQAITKVTIDQIEGLDVALANAQRETNSTSKEAADALAALAAQGQNANEAVQSLVPTLQLAKIAGIDVAQAAGLVDDTLDQFGLTTEHAAHVVDVLVTASKGSKEGLTGMSDALSRLSPLARAIGLDFEKTVGILGLLTQNGFSAQAATKGLSKIFEELQDPTSQLRINLLGLGDGTADFGAAVKALSQPGAQANRALLDLDGTARKLVLFFAQQAPGALDQFTAGLRNVDGQASKTLKTIQDNLSGAFTGFGNAIDRIGEQLAKPLLAPLKDELVKLSGALDTFSQSPAFAEIQKELGDLFKVAIEGFDNVLQNIDWKQFAEDGKNAIVDLKGSLKTVADDAHVIADAINEITHAFGLLAQASGKTLDLISAGPTRRLAAQLIDEITGSTEKLDAASVQASIAVDDLKGKIEGVGTAAPVTSAAITDVGDNAAITIVPAKLLGEQLAKLSADAKNSAVGIDAVATSTDKLQNLKEAKQNFDDASAALLRLEQSGSATANELEAASLKVQRTANSYETLRVSADQAAQGASNLEGAFKGLGVQSVASLQLAAEKAKALFVDIDQGSARTTAGLADRQQAFLAYAEIAVKAAAAANDGSIEQVKGQLEATAATLGTVDALEKVLSQYNKLSNVKPPPPPNLAPTVHDIQNVKNAADAAGESLQRVGNQVVQSSESITAETGKLKDFAIQMQGFGQKAVDALNQVSLAAGKNLFDGTQAGFQAYISALKRGFDEVGARVEGQRSVVRGAASDLATLSDVQLESLVKLHGGFDAAAASLANLSQQARDGAGDFGLLGESDLSPLSASAEQVYQRILQLKQVAQDATRSLQDMNKTLQDQADQRAGNNQAIEDRRFAEQLRQIDELAKKGGAAAVAEAARARELALKEHQAKLKEIDEQASHQIASDNKVAASRNKQTNNTSSSTGGGSLNGATQASQLSGGVTVNVHIDTFNHLRPGDNNALATELARFIGPAANQIALRSR